MYIQKIRAITGRTWREVIGQSLLFMWPLALDLWLEEDKNDKECKWWTEGGSEAFYRLFFV